MSMAGRDARLVTAACVLIAVGPVTGCGPDAAESGSSRSAVSGLPTLAVQPPLPPDAVWAQPMPVGELMLSPDDCFALGEPDTIVYAPYGSVVSPDGGGFILDGREFRLGQALHGFSGYAQSFRSVPSPSQVLTDCRPKKVVMLFQG